MRLEELDATEASRRIHSGELTSEVLVRACLDRIAERDPEIQALAFFDRDLALAQARARDAETPRSPLHGLPVLLKDIIDTADMPTQYGSPLYEGHRPSRDAAVVTLLLQAGAVLLGKAHTVEFASLGRVPPTRNPRDLARTPGGSSSGSAAAVADFMVPLALGTQTGGSTIRPASFCGICGMKPSFGRLPVWGVRPYAPSLDTLGLFARSVSDLRLLFETLCLTESPKDALVPRTLRIGLLRTTLWERTEPETRRAVERAADLFSGIGATVEDVTFDELERVTEAQDTVMHGEGRASFLAELSLHGRDALHREIVDEIENRKNITPGQMREAYDLLGAMRAKLDQSLSNWDAWLTPAVPGAAPKGLESTGSAALNRPWTALHVPAVTLPMPLDPPVGVQLVTRRFDDERLLEVARALERIE